MTTSATRWGPGPNAEAIQAWDGPLFDRQVDDALREGLSDFAGDDGVRAPASTWIVTASA
jgi:hypothetical protein